MNKTLLIGLVLILLTGIQLWVTTRVSGYYLQVLSAVVTMGFAFAAIVVLFRSLGKISDHS